MCRGLAYLHRVVGVCHRDIKPQNLLVSFLILLFFLSWGSCTMMVLSNLLSSFDHLGTIFHVKFQFHTCRVFAVFFMQTCLFAL
jgi:serine/threonine protein kinase